MDQRKGCYSAFPHRARKKERRIMVVNDDATDEKLADRSNTTSGARKGLSWGAVAE